jgi:general secretion pathway protein G
MKNSKKAFTMIELIFVIVILGILSSIAISKMAVTRDDAIITKGRSQVASIRNAITLAKSIRMMEGKASLYPDTLDSSAGKLFDMAKDGTKLLDYPIYEKKADGHWTKKSNNVYTFNVLGSGIDFTYNNTSGSFDCDHTNKTCKLLTE